MSCKFDAVLFEIRYILSLSVLPWKGHPCSICTLLWRLIARIFFTSFESRSDPNRSYRMWVASFVNGEKRWVTTFLKVGVPFLIVDRHSRQFLPSFDQCSVLQWMNHKIIALLGLPANWNFDGVRRALVLAPDNLALANGELDQWLLFAMSLPHWRLMSTVMS